MIKTEKPFETRVKNGDLSHIWAFATYTYEGPIYQSLCGLIKAEDELWADDKRAPSIIALYVPKKCCRCQNPVQPEQEHHVACCFQVTGGLEPCDCPLSTVERVQPELSPTEER